MKNLIYIKSYYTLIYYKEKKGIKFEIIQVIIKNGSGIKFKIIQNCLQGRLILHSHSTTILLGDIESATRVIPTGIAFMHAGRLCKSYFRLTATVHGERNCERALTERQP